MSSLQTPAPPDTVTNPRERDVFIPADVRHATAFVRWRRRLSWPVGIYTTPLLVLVLWELLASCGILDPMYAPAPSSIVGTGIDLWRQGVLGPDLVISLQRVTVGFLAGLAVGVVTGIIGGLLRSGENLLNGLMQVANTIPLLALLPLFVVWFGIGELPKTIVIAFGAFLPMYLNLFSAIRGVDQRLIEMARVNSAGRRRLISQVLLPGAMPGFLLGLRFSLAYSILGLVAAETINAEKGLGFLITQGQTYMQVNQVFVGLVIYSVLGLACDQFVRILERVLLSWRPSYRAT